MACYVKIQYWKRTLAIVSKKKNNNNSSRVNYAVKLALADYEFW